MTNKELASILVEDISTEIYDALCSLHNSSIQEKDEEIKNEYKDWTRNDIVAYEIENCLDYFDIEYKDLKQYKEDDNDFWNDRNKNNSYWCDIRSEYADSQVEIYSYHLWRRAAILSEYIEQAMNEFGNSEDIIKKRGLTGLFEQGEYFFYEAFASEVLEALKKYTQENEF